MDPDDVDAMWYAPKTAAAAIMHNAPRGQSDPGSAPAGAGVLALPAPLPAPPPIGQVRAGVHGNVFADTGYIPPLL